MSEIALRVPKLPGPGSILASQLRYQLTLLGRNPRAIAAGLVLPGALLALERGSTRHITMAQAAPKIAGLVAFSAVAIAFFTHANGLIVAREDGVLRRWHASPLPSWAYFAGRIIATMAVTAAAGLILVLVAVAMTGVHLTAHAVLGLLVVDMLAALALAAAGTAITAIIPSAQSAQPVLMLTYIPLIVLSGAFGAITSLPHWVNTAMTYLPVQPAIDAGSRALQQGGTMLVWPPSAAGMSGHDLAVLAGWVVGGLLVSFRYFAWDPHRPGHARPAEARTTLRSAK
jgi:ABC-2 type transport system permease protein